MGDAEVLHVTVFVPRDDESVAAVSVAFSESDVSRVDELGSAPLGELLVSGSVAIGGIVMAINSLRRSWRKGVVVDAYDGQLAIRQDPALPRGMVVVRSSGGQVTVQDGSPLTPDALSQSEPPGIQL